MYSNHLSIKDRLIGFYDDCGNVSSVPRTLYPAQAKCLHESNEVLLFELFEIKIAK